jgi:hypothetical protein
LGKVLERERAQRRRVEAFLEGRSMNRMRESGCWGRDVASNVGVTWAWGGGEHLMLGVGLWMLAGASRRQGTHGRREWGCGGWQGRMPVGHMWAAKVARA